jgi:hypothetical protein
MYMNHSYVMDTFRGDSQTAEVMRTELAPDDDPRAQLERDGQPASNGTRGGSPTGASDRSRRWAVLSPNLLAAGPSLGQRVGKQVGQRKQSPAIT